MGEKATDNEWYFFEQYWFCEEGSCEFGGYENGGGIPHARRHFEKTGHETRVIQTHNYHYYVKEDSKGGK